MEDSKEKDNRITILLFVVSRVGKEKFRGFFPREKKKKISSQREEKYGLTKDWKRAMELFFSTRISTRRKWIVATLEIPFHTLYGNEVGFLVG